MRSLLESVRVGQPVDVAPFAAAAAALDPLVGLADIIDQKLPRAQVWSLTEGAAVRVPQVAPDGCAGGLLVGHDLGSSWAGSQIVSGTSRP